MDIDTLKSGIDYYVSSTSSLTPTIFSATAVVVSLVSICITIYLFGKKQKHDEFAYLGNVWNDVINTYTKFPKYLDINFTENYFKIEDKDEEKNYEAFCYKVWGFAEDIIVKEFGGNLQFKPAFQWICLFHYEWLRRNPLFFTLDEFWEAVEQARNVPNLIFRQKPIPHKGDDIDWDIVAENYHDYILSPFAEEMVTTDQSGVCRNLLLEELRKIPDSELANMEIADLGCGPGNMLPFLAGRIRNIVAIDKSAKSLKIAQRVANACSLTLATINVDFREFSVENRFDLIICSSAILPKSRADVLTILKNIRNALKPGGRLMAIMPSFDTTEYLHQLWRDRYTKYFGNADHADRCIQAFRLAKKFDESILSYADDSVNSQCYHTPKSIRNEFTEAGLQLESEPKKIYYPWDLCRRYDYGNFPDADEEIWDWYVAARRVDNSPAS